MQTSSLSNSLSRMQRLRRMFDAARREPLASRVDLLRIQALLLKAQQRLAEAVALQMPHPAPVLIPIPVRRR